MTPEKHADLTSLKMLSKAEVKIVPFPAARRVGYVQKLARLLVTYSDRGAEQALGARLQTQRTVMLRRGISPDIVEREVRAFELAVRAELWRVLLCNGGDAA